jgi:hypothetical protein
MTTLLLLTLARESDPRRRNVSTIRVALEMSLPEGGDQDLLLRTTVTLRENLHKPITALRETLTRTFGEPRSIGSDGSYRIYTYLSTDHPKDVRNKVRYEVPMRPGDTIQGPSLMRDVDEAIRDEVDAFVAAPSILMTALSLTPPGAVTHPKSLKLNMMIMYWIERAYNVRIKKSPLYALTRRRHLSRGSMVDAILYLVQHPRLRLAWERTSC